MEKYIAERELLYSLKGETTRKKLIIRICEPYPIEKSSWNFEFPPGAYSCKIIFDGLPNMLVEEVQGADSIQALALATDVDSYLKGLEKKYDLYWASGEPYFEDR